MAAPPPRKFGEKIALLQQQALESSAAFDSVMSDVQNITRQHRVPPIASQSSPRTPPHAPPSHSTGSTSPQQHSQHTSPTRQSLTGSLADFSINLSPNSSGTYGRGPDGLQEAVNDLQSLRKEVYPCASHATASTTTTNASHSRHHSPHHHHHHHPHHRGSTSPVGRISNSSKGSVGSHPPTHLSPPPDGLPRSNSVPSLHQHLASSHPVSPPHEGGHLLGVQFRYKSLLDVSPHQHSGHQRSANMAIPGATNSSGSLLLQAGVHQQQFHCGNVGSGGGPGGGGGGLGGAGLIGLANTGSLPDLTQREHLQPSNAISHVLPSLDNGQYHGSLPNGPYSSGCPPTSSPQRQSPQSGTSPGPSPSLSRRQKPKPYPQPPNRTPVSQNLLSVPVATVVNSNYLHTCKGTVMVDPGMGDAGMAVGFPSSPPYTSLYSPSPGGGSIPSSPSHHGGNGSGMMSHGSCNNTGASSGLMHGNNMQQLRQQHQFQAYRDPPSPQLSPRSSPGPPSHCGMQQTASAAPVSVGGVGVYRSNSPDSRSAPPSPGCLPSQASPSPVSSPGITISKPFTYENVAPYTGLHPTQLHHQFEQITVMDGPVNNIDSRTQPMNTDGVLYSSSTSTSLPGANPACLPYQPTSSGQMVPNTAQPTSQQALPSMGALPQLPPLTQLPPSPLQQPPASPSPSLGSHSPATPGGSNSQQSINMNPATPQTPQTPNSIPKVVLTDHDGNNDILKDFNSVFEDDPVNLQNFLSQLSGVEDVTMCSQELEFGSMVEADATAALNFHPTDQQL